MVDRQAESVDHSWERLSGTDRQRSYLLAAGTGSRPALQALIDELTPLVWHVARGNHLDRAAAENVVQTVWLQLFDHLDRFTEPRALTSWLITTARRESRRAAEPRSRPMPLTDEVTETLISAEPAPEDAVLRAERDRQVWRAFSKLPARCQELLRLTVLAGRVEYGAVADALRMPRGSVGPTRARCIEQLRDLLDAEKAARPTREEELPGRLDALLDRADPAPDGLTTRTVVAAAADDTAKNLRSRAIPVAPERRASVTLDQTVFVYVAGDDLPAAQKLAEAITEVLAQHEIEAVPEGPPVITSWAQRFKLRVKRTTSRSEVKQRLQKVEHALEVVALQKPMSEVNAQHAEAVNKLLSSADKVDSFVALVGSMLLVKHTDEAGRVNAYAQTLSVAQVRALESNQHLLKSPVELLAHLETLSCSDEVPPASPNQEVNGAVRRGAGHSARPQLTNPDRVRSTNSDL